jgi:acetylornithine deacetylase/succinyl-diaminopimelate desuccinylase-like protein
VVGVFQPVKVYGKLAGTDMRHLVRYGGTPTLVLGPGDDELAHVANESVGVERLARAAKMYALIILRWCN